MNDNLCFASVVVALSVVAFGCAAPDTASPDLDATIHGTIAESVVTRDDGNSVRGNVIDPFHWSAASGPNLVAPGTRFDHPLDVELPSLRSSPSVFLSVTPDGRVAFWATFDGGEVTPEQIAVSGFSTLVKLSRPDGRIETVRLVLDPKAP